MQTAEQFSWSFMEAVGAAKNWRAIRLLLGTMVAGTASLALFAASGSPVVIFFGSLVALAVWFYGWNATGIMLLDSVQGVNQPSAGQAILRSLGSSHRLIVVFLGAGLLFVLAVLLMAILLLFGKIPGIGPLLSFITTPAAALVLGFLWACLTYLVLPFAAVAVWNGEGVMRVFSNLMAIARHRFMSVLLQQFFLIVLVLIIMLVIFSALFVGSLITAGLGISVASSGNFGGGYGGYGGMGGMGLMSSLASGGSALLLLFGIATLVPTVIAAQGMCRIYLSALEGLDLEQNESMLRGGLAQAREKMEEARRAAAQAAANAREARQAAAPESEPAPAPTPAPAPAPVPAPTSAPKQATACSFCNAPLDADASFCGECGRKVGG